MTWQSLQRIEDVDALIAASALRPQLIFKHSTRCGTSAMAKGRVERQLNNLGQVMDLHLLDLLAHREVSDFITQRLDVYHQSPQTILLVNGEVVLDQSHIEIDPHELMDVLQAKP